MNSISVPDKSDQDASPRVSDRTTLLDCVRLDVEKQYLRMQERVNESTAPVPATEPRRISSVQLRQIMQNVLDVMEAFDDEDD